MYGRICNSTIEKKKKIGTKVLYFHTKPGDVFEHFPNRIHSDTPCKKFQKAANKSNEAILNKRKDLFLFSLTLFIPSKTKQNDFGEVFP